MAKFLRPISFLICDLWTSLRQEKLEIVFSKLILVACRYMSEDTANIWFIEGRFRDMKPQGSENSEASRKEAGCRNRSKNICTLVVSFGFSFRCVLVWCTFFTCKWTYDIFADQDRMNFHVVPPLNSVAHASFYSASLWTAKTILKIADESLIDDWNKQYPKAALIIPSYSIARSIAEFSHNSFLPGRTAYVLATQSFLWMGWWTKTRRHTTPARLGYILIGILFTKLDRVRR